MRPTDHSAGDQSRSRAVSLFFAIYHLQGKEKNIHPHNLERFISIFHLLLEPHFPCRPHSPLSLTSPSHFFSPYKYSPKPLPRGLNLSLTKISSLQLSLSLSLELSKLSWSPTTTKTPRPSNSFAVMAGKYSLATPTARSATPAASHVSSPSIAPFLSQVCLIFPFPDSIFL